VGNAENLGWKIDQLLTESSIWTDDERLPSQRQQPRVPEVNQKAPDASRDMARLDGEITALKIDLRKLVAAWEQFQKGDMAFFRADQVKDPEDASRMEDQLQSLPQIYAKLAAKLEHLDKLVSGGAAGCPS